MMYHGKRIWGCDQGCNFSTFFAGVFQCIIWTGLQALFEKVLYEVSAYLLFREQKEKSISKKFYGIFWVSHLWQRLEVNVSVYGAPGDCVFCPAMGKEGERKTRWEGGRETSSPSVVTPIKKWFFRFREISKFLRHPKKCLKNKNQMKKRSKYFALGSRTQETEIEIS